MRQCQFMALSGRRILDRIQLHTIMRVTTIPLPLASLLITGPLEPLAGPTRATCARSTSRSAYAGTMRPDHGGMPAGWAYVPDGAKGAGLVLDSGSDQLSKRHGRNDSRAPRFRRKSTHKS